MIENDYNGIMETFQIKKLDIEIDYFFKQFLKVFITFSPIWLKLRSTIVVCIRGVQIM